MLPLRRELVTAASRIMLPAYPVGLAWIGLAYMFGDPDRTLSPSLDPARHFMPITAWGALFFALAILLALGYLRHSRDVTVFVLMMAAGAFAMWAGFFGYAVITVPDASLVAPMWPLFGMTAVIASATSIARSEGADR